MKSRGKTGAGIITGWSSMGLPAVFLLCIFFFFLGFFGSSLFSQQVENESASLHITRPRPRMLNQNEYDPMPQGDSGDDYFTTIPFQILSWKPRALYFPGFATEQQCNGIIKMAKVKLAPSTLALRKGETAENTKDIRTSSGMFVSSYEDKTGILDQIEKKIERATMIPRRHGEAFNVLRYDLGQKYNSHYDAFNPTEYGPQKSQRIASFLLYLSDVEEGGETMFPFENGENADSNYDFRKCIGLKIKPRKGDGLLFYSLYPNGTIDPTSLHGSCPVIKGQKWVATKWLRNEEDFD
ncbi:2-oxoglutarate (2OG) and Fe(II)-dependent oxygenase superfamily protein [Artemisia annua]|uniref:procollagen-proline 4-dioxygenase n=1 Tax=Artemisia annua TaxID=35608 RepID=A0A2U1KVM6_ARTAN|nr:2-oxoglutarate (2OG) and Fe(II)-dependent oxygenase superfamily protein [Artemisia annua]